MFHEISIGYTNLYGDGFSVRMWSLRLRWSRHNALIGYDEKRPGAQNAHEGDAPAATGKHCEADLSRESHVARGHEERTRYTGHDDGPAADTLHDVLPARWKLF